jgi:hypothetical protein
MSSDARVRTERLLCCVSAFFLRIHLLVMTPVRRLVSHSLCRRPQSYNKPDRVVEEAKASTYVDPTDDELPDSDRGRLCGAPV